MGGERRVSIAITKVFSGGVLIALGFTTIAALTFLVRETHQRHAVLAAAEHRASAASRALVDLGHPEWLILLDPQVQAALSTQPSSDVPVALTCKLDHVGLGVGSSKAATTLPESDVKCDAGRTRLLIDSFERFQAIAGALHDPTALYDSYALRGEKLAEIYACVFDLQDTMIPQADLTIAIDSERARGARSREATLVSARRRLTGLNGAADELAAFIAASDAAGENTSLRVKDLLRILAAEIPNALERHREAAQGFVESTAAPR